MSERFARVGGVELCYESLGSEDGPPLLLVMGLGSQMLLWNEVFCEQLVQRGARVIRFDNRDCGRSTIFSNSRPPTLRQLALRDKRGAAYPLPALAQDTIGLLDALGIDRADVVGASMGGMIAQLLAIAHPRRVRSLTSIMSSTGNWRVGLPHPRMALLMVRRARTDREGYVADFTHTMTAIGSKTHPPGRDELRELGERCWDRGVHPAGTARHLGAIQTAEDRTAALGALRMPVTVIHGAQDPLIHRSGGRATAKAIPGARLLMLEGMGHDLPRALWPEIADAITENIAAGGP